MAKKAYAFLYDRISSTSEKERASNVFKKLEDELSGLLSNHEPEIRSGLGEVLACLHRCYKENDTVFQTIRNDLQGLPYSVCGENEAKVTNLVEQPIATVFAFEHIIDPAELKNIEQKVKEARAFIQQHISDITNFGTSMSETFTIIERTKGLGNDNVAKMDANNKSKIGEFNADLFFVLSIFDDEQQENYLGIHIAWIKDVETEFNSKYEFAVDEFMARALSTDILVRSANALLKADKALSFLSNREKLSEKKQLCIQAVERLDRILVEINRLPKEKSEVLRAMMSKHLIISLFPVGNIVALFNILSALKPFFPALASDNSFYVELRQSLIGKFKTFSVGHFIAIVFSAGLSFVVQPDTKPVFYVVSASFLISGLVLLSQSKALKRLHPPPSNLKSEKTGLTFS